MLRDFIEDDGQRLMFVFDYMTDRAFFIEMKESEPGKELKEPVCTVSMGAAPAQIVDMDEFDAAIDAKAAKQAAVTDAVIDDDFYDNDGYDPEDIAGFDEMDLR